MIFGQSHPEGSMMSSPHHERFPISLADTDPATCRLIDAGDEGAEAPALLHWALAQQEEPLP